MEKKKTHVFVTKGNVGSDRIVGLLTHRLTRSYVSSKICHLFLVPPEFIAFLMFFFKLTHFLNSNWKQKKAKSLVSNKR